jgi:zinc transporter 1/2/3
VTTRDSLLYRGTTTKHIGEPIVQTLFKKSRIPVFHNYLLEDITLANMEAAMEVARLVLRQSDASGAETQPEAPITCSQQNEYDGRMGVRISAIFVILVGSLFGKSSLPTPTTAIITPPHILTPPGAVFPTFAKRSNSQLVPSWVFFGAKYFGSGVIVATAFIHLLAPANEALGNECLTGVIASYPWPEGIALMTIFVMFFLELMVMRYGNFGGDHEHSHDGGLSQNQSHDSHSLEESKAPPADIESATPGLRGDDHLGHQRDHIDNDEINRAWPAQQGPINPESYSAQLTAVFILEFGVIFHSIFIGLTLAVSGAEFITLYIVLVFHQTFEGLGLGARLAEVPWPKTKRWTPYLLGLGYGLSTPIAIAIGLGVRQSFAPEGQTTLLVNGVFDSISAGILIYTGLIELMAHEFMFSPYMQKGPVTRTINAFMLMTLGAGMFEIHSLSLIM